MTLSVLQLIAVRTVDSILARGIAVAQGLGIDPTTWRTGDPSKAQFNFTAEVLGESDPIVAQFCKSGFLSTAERDWKTVNGHEVYGVDRTEATAATSSVTIQNTGSRFYEIHARDLVFKSSLSGKTYHNIADAPGPLAGGVTLALDVEADEEGTDSNAGVNEIDTLVTTLLGVNVIASTAAVALDQQSDPSLEDQCLASLGATSPDGPADAYEYVARNSKLTGVQDVTRASSSGDAGNLAVTIYVASPSGPVAGASVTAVQAAIERWATPLCFTPTTVNSIADVTGYSATITGADLPLDAVTKIEDALGAVFSALPIGKGAGYDIDPTTFTTAIRNAVPQITAIPTYAPSTIVHVAAGHVPVLGSVTVTVV